MTNNPYQAPASDVSNQGGAHTYQPKVFSTSGRIGRLRYLAYLLATYVFIIPGALLTAIGGASGDGAEDPSVLFIIGAIIAIVGYIAMFVYAFILAKRRFNDMDKSGWLSLLFFVPLVNFFVGLWLMFGGGTPQPNQYGPAPCENSLAVKIFGLIAPILVIIAIIGVLAAVSIPAYQDYVERANSQQESLYEE